ncbi:MAG: tetratricopeptide repeat protein [Proteobacteria bacterium]|nr:tetratricopeptide repeat protein [Pseudomonadota bacterium]
MAITAAASPLGRARSALAEGNLREAQIACRQVLTRNPRHGEALFLLGVVAMQAKDAKAAADLFRRAIAAEPKHADAHMNLGIALNLLGRKGDGREALETAAKLKPNSPQIQYNLGLAEMESGRHDQALAHFRKAARAAPRDATVLGALGVLQMQMGQARDGVRTLKKAAAVLPHRASAFRNLGTALQSVGDADAAVEAFAKARALAPDDAATKVLAASALAQVRRTFEALPLFREALQEKPEIPGGANNYGLALKADLRFDEAVAEFRKAAAARPGDARVASNLADALVLAGNAGEAILVLKALPESRDRDHVANQIANIQERQGRFDDAAATFEEVLHRNPENVWALAGLVDNRGRELSPAREQTLADLVARGDLPDREQIRAAFALGHLHDRRGDFDAAFAHFAAGNRVRVRAQPFDIGAHIRRVTELIKTYSPALLARAPDLATKSELPVFVVGMPRSGATLVERMLAAHPDAFGAGEFHDLFVLRRNLPYAGSGGSYPSCVAKLSREHVAPLAEWLLARRRALAPQALRVVDKTPDHVFDVGLAALLVAPLRVIHCERDVRDTCLSIFTNTVGGQHGYAGDLKTLGAWAAHVSRLMRHWQACLPIRTVAYEQLVRNPVATARQLAHDAGLHWNDAVLDFRTSDQTVATASRWQVRQLLTTQAIGRWKNYAAYLAPLERALEEFGEAD